jgi:hypothetical protein
LPIKDQSIYPPYWKQFSLYIRKERAGDRCERCQVRNGAAISRGRFDGEGSLMWFDHGTGETGDAENGYLYEPMHPENFPLFETMTTIVLTVAHLDHEGGPCDCKARTGRKCARPDHVKALCQRCHLQMDMPHHIANRQRSLAVKKDAGRHLFSEIV